MMNDNATGVLNMAKKPGMPVRISDEAIRWARIASGYTGESVATYVSRIIVERAQQDAERLHDQLKGRGLQPPSPFDEPPKRGKK